MKDLYAFIAAVCVVGCALVIGLLLGPVWWESHVAPERLVKTVENSQILPWWWTSSPVGGLAFDRRAYLCVVDVGTGQFFPMGTMDTGRREPRDVAAYAPTEWFAWQCPLGTIVEMESGEVAWHRARIAEAQAQRRMEAERHQRAKDLARSGVGSRQD